jgi:hypothetical protein
MNTYEEIVENIGEHSIEKEERLEYEFDIKSHQEFLDKRKNSYGVIRFFTTKEKQTPELNEVWS